MLCHTRKLSDHVRLGIHGFALCPQCKERWFGTTLSVVASRRNRMSQCKSCLQSSQVNFIPNTNGSSTYISSLTAENDMDPWTCLDHMLLPQLSHIEEMIIARLHPFMRVYRLQGGQLGYKGSVANLEQATCEFVSLLPLLPHELPCLIVRKPNSGSLSDYTDFRVSRNNIMAWLTFLKRENPYYADIDLVLAYTRCLSIPEDGSIVESIRSIDDGTSNLFCQHTFLSFR